MAHSLAMRGISRTTGDYLMFNLFVASEIPLDAVPSDLSTKQIACWAILSMQKHAHASGSAHNMAMQRWSFAITRHPHYQY